MRWPAVAGLLAVIGCAAETSPKPPQPAQQAGEAGAWEAAPVPRIRQERGPSRFAPPEARRELGWPDRFYGTPAGAPYNPRF